MVPNPAHGQLNRERGFCVYTSYILSFYSTDNSTRICPPVQGSVCDVRIGHPNRGGSGILECLMYVCVVGFFITVCVLCCRFQQSGLLLLLTVQLNRLID